MGTHKKCFGREINMTRQQSEEQINPLLQNDCQSGGIFVEFSLTWIILFQHFGSQAPNFFKNPRGEVW